MEKETLRKVNQVVSILSTGPHTAEDLTKEIYKTLTTHHLGFIFSILESHIDTGMVIPVFEHRTLLFKLNLGKPPAKEQMVMKWPSDQIQPDTLATEKKLENTTKICSVCNKPKPISDFPETGCPNSGQCKDCRSAFQKKYQRDRKKRAEEKSPSEPIPKKKTQDDEPVAKAPDGTFAFLQWMEKLGRKNGILVFDLKNFIDDNPLITREQAEKIVFYQIQQGSLLQTGKETFRTVK
jgi:hypothetical protein